LSCLDDFIELTCERRKYFDPIKIKLEIHFEYVFLIYLAENYLCDDNFPFWEIRRGVSLRLVGIKILDDLKKNHAIVRGPLDAWRKEVEEANWSSSQDIKYKFASASFLENNQVIFNIKGKRYRVVIKVDYERKIVLVEWAGTHAEYSKKY
jgi:mRNA interferase HigB